MMLFTLDSISFSDGGGAVVGGAACASTSLLIDAFPA